MRATRFLHRSYAVALVGVSATALLSPALARSAASTPVRLTDSPTTNAWYDNVLVEGGVPARYTTATVVLTGIGPTGETETLSGKVHVSQVKTDGTAVRYRYFFKEFQRVGTPPAWGAGATQTVKIRACDRRRKCETVTWQSIDSEFDGQLRCGRWKGLGHGTKHCDESPDWRLVRK